MPAPAGTTAVNQSVIGWGLDLAYSSNGGSTYTSLAQLEDVTQPDYKVTDVDNTGLLSPNATRQFRPGLISPGDCKFKMIFLASLKATILSLLYSRSIYTWKITYPDGASNSSTEIFSGYVNSYSGENPLDNNIMADVGIKVTGQGAFNPGS